MSNFGEAVVWYLGMTLEELEKRAIIAALKLNRNNKTLTAQSLGITVRTIDNKLQQYDMKTTKENFTPPKREKILERALENVQRTGAFGSDHRVDSKQTKAILDNSGQPVVTTLAGGRMSDEDLERLRARKKSMATNAGQLQDESTDGVRTEGGSPEESVEEVSAQPAVPVSERQEIQDVPLELTTPSGRQQNSGNLQKGNARTNPIHNSSKRNR